MIFNITNIYIYMFVNSGLIYLFIINKLVNVQKKNISYWDHLLLYLVIFQTLSIILGIFFKTLSFYNMELEVRPLFMVEGDSNNSSSNSTVANNSTTNTAATAVTQTASSNTASVSVTQNEHSPNRTVIERKVILDNGAFSEGIRSIFIYGSAGYRAHFVRGGTPGTKFIIMAGAIATDLFTRASLNAINDPNYIKDHVLNWKITRDALKNDGVHIDVSNDKEFLKKLTEKFLPEDFSVQLDSIYQDILSQVLSYFQPQTVNYPVELLMDQHHYLAIFLFILILLLSIFIFILAYMAVLIIFKDKILSFITNKYLLLYLKCNTN